MNKLSEATSMKAIICALDIKAPRLRDKNERLLMAEESAQELARLAATLGLEVVGTVIQERYSPDPATYLGRGKVQEIAELVSGTKRHMCSLTASCLHPNRTIWKKTSESRCLIGQRSSSGSSPSGQNQRRQAASGACRQAA